MQYTVPPKWFYKPVVVKKLKAIQQELLPLLYKEFPEFETSEGRFVYVDRSRIEPYAPLYTKFIKSMGLLDRWVFSAFVTTSPIGDPIPIHIDSMDWRNKCYGLNIPLINCEGTYTAFYDTEICEEQPVKDSNVIHEVRIQREGAPATEICRVEATNTMWINTMIPHMPLSTHSKPRALITARFIPEVHDLIYK